MSRKTTFLLFIAKLLSRKAVPIYNPISGKSEYPFSLTWPEFDLYVLSLPI